MTDFFLTKPISVKQLEDAGFIIKYHGSNSYYSLAKDNNESIIELKNDKLYTFGGREIHNSLQIVQDVCKIFDTDVISDEFGFEEEYCHECHTEEDYIALCNKHAKLTMEYYNLTR